MANALDGAAASSIPNVADTENPSLEELCLTGAASRATPMVMPGELQHATALEPHYYTDPKWSAFERDQIFCNNWQYATHAGALPDPGDHVVTEIAGQPLILVAQKEGGIRAFHNVCRHRAAPLAICNGKRASRLRCLYHGWQYGLDGKLLAAPEMREAEGFDINDIALSEVKVKVWQGLVFVAVNADAPPFERIFADIAGRIAPQDASQYRFLRHDVYDVSCNWKVYVDNYAEGYHLPFVHPSLTQAVDYSDYRSELGDFYSLQVSPISETNGPYGEGTGYYYLVYPNLMLNFVPGRLQLDRVLPTGQGSCSVDFVWFYADAAHMTQRAEHDIAFTDQVQAEDASICEHVQRGLSSGSYRPGRLSPKREAGLWHFQQLLRGDYARGENSTE